MLTQAQQVELTKAMAKSVESAFKQVSDGMMAQLRQQTANDNEPPSTRRSTKGSSATAGMEANRRLTSSVKNLNKHIGASADIFGDLNKTAKGYHSELERTMRLYGQVQDQMTVTYRAHRKMRDVIGQDVRAVTERMKVEEGRVKSEQEYVEHLKDMKKAAKDFVDEVKSSTTPGGGNNAPGGRNNNNNNNNNNQSSPFDKVDVIGDFVGEVSGKLLGLASISKGLTATFEDFQYALQTSSRVTMSTLTDSVQMGMSARALMEMQAEFRTDAMKTAGGLKSWTNNLKASQLDLIAYTGSLQEANKINAQLRNTYMKLGMSLEEVTDMLGTTSQGMMSNFTKMSAITGKTISEITKVVSSVTSTDENRELLLKMTKEQRTDFVKNQTALVTRYTMLTGSMERAQSMIEQQNRNRNKSSIDRFKESVRMRAAGGMVGIDSDVMARFAELNNKAPGSLTEDERAELANARGEIARRLNEMRSSDSMHERMVGDQMIAKLDLGENMVFDRGMDIKMDEAAVAEQQAKNLAATINNMTGGKEALGLLSSIDSVLKQSLTPLAAAALIYFGQRMMKTGVGLDVLDALGDRRNNDGKPGRKKRGFIGKRTRTALLGREMLMQSQAAGSGLGKAGKLLAKGGAPTAIVAQGASMALDALWTPDTSDGTKAKEMTMDTIDTASMALMGATIGSFIAPGVGTAVGAALGGVVGAAYAFSNDDYFKTVSEIESNRHANESRKHDMEMKLVQAEWEYRKNNFEAFQQEAGPGFQGKMQELLDRHNSGLDDTQKVTLDGFAKYEDLRKTLSETLNDSELKKMDELYRDEKNNMAARHNKQMQNMRQIHNLNLQQTDAYKEVMKIESTMKALEDFDTNGWFSTDDIDADDLNTALGQGTVEDSAAVLRDIAKNSGALTAAEFDKLASSGTFAQMANDMKQTGSFDFDDIKDEESQKAMRKLFESMESGEEGNKYFRDKLQTRLDSSNARVDDLDAQVKQRQTDTVDGTQATKGKDAESLKNMAAYIDGRLSPEELKAAGFSSAQEVVDRMSKGDDVYSPEIKKALGEFNHIAAGGELTKQIATNGGMVTANVKPGSTSDEEMRVKPGTRIEPQTAEQMMFDTENANMLRTYLKELGLSQEQMQSMGGNSVNEIVSNALDGGVIENQSLLRYMENAYMHIDPKHDKADVESERSALSRIEGMIPEFLRKSETAVIQPPLDPKRIDGTIEVKTPYEELNKPKPKPVETAAVTEPVKAKPVAEPTRVEELPLAEPIAKVEEPKVEPTIAPPAPARIETAAPAGDQLAAKAASVGTNYEDQFAKIKAYEKERKQKISDSADEKISDGKITLNEVVEQLKLIHANNQQNAQRMIDHYKGAETAEERRHLQNQIFGEKKMQSMGAGKAGS